MPEKQASERLLVSYYGDDFTGSTDALESLTAAGVRTALFRTRGSNSQILLALLH